MEPNEGMAGWMAGWLDGCEDTLVIVLGDVMGRVDTELLIHVMGAVSRRRVVWRWCLCGGRD